MRLVTAALLLLAGCTAASHDVPAPLSAAPGTKRLATASNRPHHHGKHRPRRAPLLSGSSRSLRRQPVAQLPPNWSAVARCESSGNPRAVDPSGRYFGLYQFDIQTWRSIGGTGLPSDASPAEQTARAELLYASRGSAPWPVCGSHLGDAQ